jgi:hypothetical protein
VRPDDYAARFIAFMKNSVIINQMISINSGEQIKPRSLVESLLSHSYITR